MGVLNLGGPPPSPLKKETIPMQPMSYPSSHRTSDPPQYDTMFPQYDSGSDYPQADDGYAPAPGAAVYRPGDLAGQVYSYDQNGSSSDRDR